MQLEISDQKQNSGEGLVLGRPLGSRSALEMEGAGRDIVRPKDSTLNRLARDGSLIDINYWWDNRDVAYTGEAHLITIAPTGAGKGRSVIIPNLLTYSGPVIVTDPKGENRAVTEHARRAMGQKTIVLEPFGEHGTHSLNPFDMFKLPHSDRETDSQMFAELLATGNTGSGIDVFWHNSAFGLLSGVIAYIASLDDPEIAQRFEASEGNLSKLLSQVKKNNNGSRVTFGNLIRTLHCDDVVYNLAVMLDTIGKQIPPLAYREISAFLQKADKERSGVLSTANSYLKAFGSDKALLAMDYSSFSLREIVNGDPLTVYLIIPPDKLKSHKAMLRVWIGAMLRAITNRDSIPKQRTLMMLDECAELGTFPFLETTITLCRGYGLQTWTFWQDLSQLKHYYPFSWPTIINNCGIMQFFGANNYQVSNDLADYVGIESNIIRRLDRNEQFVMIDGKLYNCCKHDYLRDPEFRGKFKKNPFYRDHSRG